MYTISPDDITMLIWTESKARSFHGWQEVEGGRAVSGGD
jgi:hypothetical protein